MCLCLLIQTLPTFWVQQILILISLGEDPKILGTQFAKKTETKQKTIRK